MNIWSSGLFLGFAILGFGVASARAGVPAGTPYAASVLYQVQGSAQVPYFPAASGLVVGSINGQGGVTHAAIWSGPNGTVADLNPTNLPSITGSSINGTDGTYEVGVGYISFFGNQRALLWSGSAGTAVDLTPTNISGLGSVVAEGVGGGEQVGVGFVSLSIEHAFLWKGSAASVVDLQPTLLPSMTQSFAFGTDGLQQVGEAYGSAGTAYEHAILWSGSATTAVDLNPTKLSGFSNSRAEATQNGEQVGMGTLGSGGPFHALTWHGTAASAVDINPNSQTESESIATNGSQEVGAANPVSDLSSVFAMLWFGTANSAVNLQGLLPSSSNWSSSRAYSIDAAGNVFGTATGTYNGVAGTFAVEWSPVPEPSSISLLAVTGVAILRRRRC